MQDFSMIVQIYYVVLRALSGQSNFRASHCMPYWVRIFYMSFMYCSWSLFSACSRVSSTISGSWSSASIWLGCLTVCSKASLARGASHGGTYWYTWPPYDLSTCFLTLHWAFLDAHLDLLATSSLSYWLNCLLSAFLSRFLMVYSSRLWHKRPTKDAM